MKPNYNVNSQFQLFLQSYIENMVRDYIKINISVFESTIENCENDPINTPEFKCNF